MTTHSDLRKQIDNLVPAEATGLFVGGQWRDASGGGHFAVTDPSDGETLREVADAAEEDGVDKDDPSTWPAAPTRPDGQPYTAEDLMRAEDAGQHDRRWQTI